MKESSIYENISHLIQRSISRKTIVKSLHMHDKNELFFLMEGSLTEICNSHTVELHAPAIMILPANSIHLASSPDPFLYDRWKIYFDTSIVEEKSPLCKRASFFKNQGLVVINLTEEQKKVMSTLFERIEAYQYDPDACNQLILWILYELSHISNSQKFSAIAESKPYITKVIHYLSTHFDSPITLDLLSSEFFVSRAKLVADFKKSTGITVGTYLMLIRINRAKALLANGKSVAHVAHLCGYSDESHFIDLFKKQTGVTPKKYAIAYQKH